jgi:hypothetical protein
LAEYLVAGASRRLAIVSEQKNPQLFRTRWYEESRTPICEFIHDGCQNEAILLSAVTGLANQTPASDAEETRIKSAIAALNQFISHYPNLNLSGLMPRRGSNMAPKLVSAGVEISVRPDFILHGTRKGQKEVGVLKLYFSKNDPLDPDGAAYLTTALLAYARQFLTQQGAIRPRLCMVFDVFAGKVYLAPVANMRRLQDIHAACAEIARTWPHV